MNWFATVIFAILEMALRAKAHAYRFVGNSRQIGSTLVGLGALKTSRARPCLAVALSIVLIVCLTSLVTTVSAAPADPGHPASSISAGTFESGNFTFPDNLTITDYLIVDTDTLYVDSLNNKVGIGTASPTTNLNIKGTLNTALTGTINTSDTTAVANTSDDLTSEISVGDAIKIVNASDSSDFEVFTVNALTSANITLDSTPSKNWIDALGYKDSDLFRIDDGDGTGKLIVDKTGNVGIGTTSPGVKLDVKSGAVSTDVLRVLSSDDGSIFEISEDSGTGGFVGIKDASAVRQVLLHTSGDSYLNGGNVGIGTTSPNYLLEVTDGTEDAVNLSGVLYVNDTSNNVGINTTDPKAPLSFATIVGQKIEFYNAGANNEFGIGVEASELRISTGASSKIAFRTDGYNGNERMVIDADGDVGIGTTSPNYLLEVADGTEDAVNLSGVLYVNDTADGVGIGTTSPNYLLEVADGTEDAVNLSGVLYVNDTADGVGIGTTDPQEELEVVGDVNATGDINASGDICIYGGKCMSNTGIGDGDLTDVLPGYGIAVDSSGGPSPTVNLSSSSAGAGLNYTAGVLAVGDGEGAIVADGSIGFDCSEVTDSASDGMRCSSEDIVAGAGDGLSANNTDLEINEGEGVGILADILHFDCSEVTDTANDAVTCSTEDLVIGAGNGLTANNTGLQIDLYTGSGLMVDETGLSMNRSCSNGQVLKWVASGSFWNCTEDSGLGSESDTLDSVADRGASTDQNLTIDSDSDGLTNIANTLYVNGTVDGVGIGTTGPDVDLDVIGTLAVSHTSASNRLSIYTDSDRNYFEAGSGNGFRFNTTGGANFEIQNDGDVGIGTTSPNAAVHLVTGSGELTMKQHIANSITIGTNTTDGSDTDALYLSSHLDGLSAGRGAWIGLYGQDHGTYQSTVRIAAGTSGDIELMGGNVGIGTTSPSAKFTIEQTSGGWNDGIRINRSGTYWDIMNDGDLRIGVNETNRMIIKGVTGNVGIGTTSPDDAVLEVHGTTSLGPYSGSNDEDNEIFEVTYGSDRDGILVLFDNDTHTSKVVLDSSGDSYFNGGNVGIGTTSPTAKLHLNQSSGSSFLKFTQSGDSEVWHQYLQGNDFRIAEDSSDHLVIEAGGDVGIGTTSPSTALHVDTTATSDTITVGSSSNTAYSGVNMQTDETTGAWIYAVGSTYESWALTSALNIYNAGGPIAFATNGSNNRMVIDIAGKVGIGVTTPEARLEALASSGPQLMLTHTEATDYANFTVDSDGNLTILSSSGNVFIQLG